PMPVTFSIRDLRSDQVVQGRRPELYYCTAQRGRIFPVPPMRPKGRSLSSCGGEGWGEEAVCSQQRAGLIGRASRRRRCCTNEPLSPALSPLVPRGERESPGRVWWYGQDAPAQRPHCAVIHHPSSINP